MNASLSHALTNFGTAIDPIQKEGPSGRHIAVVILVAVAIVATILLLLVMMNRSSDAGEEPDACECEEPAAPYTAPLPYTTESPVNAPAPSSTPAPSSAPAPLVSRRHSHPVKQINPDF